MNETVRSRLDYLLENTKLTSDEIIADLGISYGQYYDTVNRAYSESRDTQILVYDKIGSPDNKCYLCTIIMVGDHDEMPEGWGEFQREWGQVCQGCVSDLLVLMPKEITALITAGCAYCNEKRIGLYFFDFQENVLPLPSDTVPLCKQHRRVLDEKPKETILRDFYNRVDTDKLFAITGWSSGNGPDMPIWDDMLLGDAKEE